MKKILPALLIVLCGTGCLAADYELGRFSVGDLSGWNDKVFKGRTSYKLVMDEGKMVLKSHSRRSASGMLKKVALDSGKLPGAALVLEN